MALGCAPCPVLVPGGWLTCLPPTVTSRLAVNGIFSLSLLEMELMAVMGASQVVTSASSCTFTRVCWKHPLLQCWVVVARGQRRGRSLSEEALCSFIPAQQRH